MSDDRPLIFIDVETTGLNPDRHQVWEVAWSYEIGGVFSSALPHDLGRADPAALAMTTLIVALHHRDAVARAKAEGIRRRTGITPDTDWLFPPAMLDAIGQAIRAGEAA